MINEIGEILEKHSPDELKNEPVDEISQIARDLIFSGVNVIK